jgi:hypothetical protein
VPLATWEACRRILLDPERLKTYRASRYLLTGGLGRCGLCEAKLVARPKADKRRCYVCATGPGFVGCGKIRCLADPLEELVVEAVLVALDGPGLRQAMQGQSTPASPVESELGATERRLEELASMWAAGEIERREWLAARDPLMQRRDSLQQQVATQTRRSALIALEGDVRRRWAGCSFDQQRAILFAVLDSVVVGPAVKGRNFFDPARVSLTWRV